MKLTVTKRAGMRKSDTRQVRREGNVPAVLYSPGRPCEPIVINGVEFSALLREIKPGRLSTTTFILVDGGKQRRALIKDIQYELTTYKVSHVDFEELIEGVLVNVKIPISCSGVVDCVGIKLGGFLRQIIRYIKVECEPKNIPSEFVVDVKELGIRQSKRLSDIPMPKGVKPLARLEEVVVVIAKQRG